MSRVIRRATVQATMVHVDGFDEALPFWIDVVGMVIHEDSRDSGFVILEDPDTAQRMLLVADGSGNPTDLNIGVPHESFDDVLTAMTDGGSMVLRDTVEENGFRHAQLVDPSGISILMHGDRAE